MPDLKLNVISSNVLFMLKFYCQYLTLFRDLGKRMVCSMKAEAKTNSNTDVFIFIVTTCINSINKLDYVCIQLFLGH